MKFCRLNETMTRIENIINKLSTLWPAVDKSQLSADAGNGTDLADTGREFFQNSYGLDPIEAQRAAERDVRLVEGEQFLNEHPAPRRLPWSGKRGTRT